jgi:rubrerythrin
MEFYKKAAGKVKDQKVRKMFTLLAEEEKGHIETLREKSRFLQPAITRKSEEKNHIQRIAKNLKNNVFPEIAFPKFESDLEALELGIESEKRSINALSGFLTEEKKLDVRAIFMHLIVEEKKHLVALRSLKKSLLAE